jgi:hypothetical protein
LPLRLIITPPLLLKIDAEYPLLAFTVAEGYTSSFACACDVTASIISPDPTSAASVDLVLICFSSFSARRVARRYRQSRRLSSRRSSGVRRGRNRLARASGWKGAAAEAPDLSPQHSCERTCMKPGRLLLPLLLALLMLPPVSATAQSNLGYSGSVSGLKATTDYETGKTYISVENLTVDVDPCLTGAREILFITRTITECGAAAYVVDARYDDGRCPAFRGPERYEIIRPAWFVEPSSDGRVLESGPGAVEAPPLPENASPSRAYRGCLYATEVVEESPTSFLGPFDHHLVGEQLIEAPPTLACIQLREGLDARRSEQESLRKKQARIQKQLRRIQAKEDKEPADRRKAKALKERYRDAQEDGRILATEIKDAKKSITTQCW